MDHQPSSPSSTQSHNFPLPLSSFIGRKRELAEITALLSTTRLLTLTGSGGSGKTRLAIQTATLLESSNHYADGIWWMELADLTDPALVPQVVATCLALREQRQRPLIETLIEHLHAKTALLIFDNCEHLAAACAALVESLLQGCPTLTILITSRTPLRIAGEHVWPVPPLSVPESMNSDQWGQDALAKAAPSESVQLFVARAAAIFPTFQLLEENASTITHICRKLDGLPLAIELAAARVRLLSVTQIAARLQGALELLTRGPFNAPARHQTLRATIDWSYALLSTNEQALLNRLSVFAGPFALEAVGAICSGRGLEEAAMLDLLADLVDHSLVAVTARRQTVDDGQEEEPLDYRLLETIRQYSQERLKLAGETDPLRERHLAWYLALAERAVPEIKGPDSLNWLRRLQAEHENMRAALTWSQSSGAIEQGLRLAAALHWYWDRRGYLKEGRAWLERLLQHPDAAAPLTPDLSPTLSSSVSLSLARARAAALFGAAALAFDQGDWSQAAIYAQECVLLYRALAEPAGLTMALLRLGFAVGPASEQGKQYLAEAVALSETLTDDWAAALTYFVVGQAAHFAADYTKAHGYLEVALLRMRKVGDVMFLPRILSVTGCVEMGLGAYGQARLRLEEAVEMARAIGDPRVLALVIGSLGDLLRAQEEYALAEEVYRESLTLCRAAGNEVDVAANLHNLGYVALGQGKIDAAYELMAQSLDQQRRQGNRAGVAEGLAGMAAIASAQERFGRAARLFGAAEVIAEEDRRMIWPAELIERKRHVAHLRAHMDVAAFDAAWAAGRRMNEEEAVHEAFVAPSTEPGPLAAQQILRRRAKESHLQLTRRECEVAALIARGQSNRAIGEQLVITERTAERHVANILTKLGFHSRAQIAAWVVENGLREESDPA